MTNQDNERVALVTGGSRGIGKSICERLAADGLKVFINYRSNQSSADQIANEILQRGGKATSIGFDVADSNSVSEAIDQIVREEGGIDVLVNNAGVSIDSLILRAKEEDWQNIMDINLKGAFVCSKLSLKTMIRRKNTGRIINLTSVVGQMGSAGQTMYAASKSGVIGLTKSLAKEVASRAITVNAVAPGFVQTDMTDELSDEQKNQILTGIPLRRWAEPEEIASVVSFLASAKSSYITGQVISVNGGMYL